MGRRRDLWVLVGGMGLSAIGTHITFIALPFHLRHEGPYVISAVMMATLIPIAIGAPLVGWLVDRFPNRRIMVYAQLVAAAALVGMLFALDNLPVLLLLLLALGATTAVTSPAMSALLPKLTGEDGATRGYSALATARSMGTLAGLGIGGMFAAGPGVRIALLIDAVSFVVLALALATVRAERDPRRDAGARRDSARDGLRRLRTDRVLPTAVVGLAFAVLLAVLVNVAEVYFVTEVLRAGGVAFGLIAASWAVGMVAGARLAGRLDTDRRLVVGLFGGGIGLGVVLLAPAALPSIGVTMAAWLVGGACNAAQNVAVQGLVRSRMPDELRGRAFAGMSAVIVTANVLGTFAGGPATAILGPRMVFVAAGVGTALSAAIALAIVLPRIRGIAEPAAVPPATGPVAVKHAETASASVVRTPSATGPALRKRA